METKKYGMALSGGGVRGIAHLGVIKALEEHGIFPEYIAGASAGAIVGAFYAAGHSWEEILHFFKSTSMFSWQNYTYRKPGILDTDKFEHLFATYLPGDSFASLTKTLFVSATDIEKGKNVIWKEGTLVRKVLASAAFPMVLSPVEIEGTFYADGAITNNFPVEPLLPLCDTIIGSYVSPLPVVQPGELTNSMAVLERAFKIGMAVQSEKKFPHCDILIAPHQLNEVGTFSMNRIDEVFKIGYEAATQQLQ
ncbi:patatin-like phospholipase family protein [Lewinella sp. LCG006]|uniref:patatin-like phospholipase family protein n=1 Tax=Lewinella sp. LCG006 TaxID=3231911 RepID=UPI00345F5588